MEKIDKYKPSVLYRYDGDSSFSGMSCTKYRVLSETSCGYWVKHDYDFDDSDKKWVSKTGKKRLCYPTKKEALHNLLCRRQRYLKILNAGIQRTNDIIYECKKLMKVTND